MKRLPFITVVCCLIAFFLTGCNPEKELNNTPTKQVEAFFNNYQTLNKDVIDDLNRVVDNKTEFNAEQKKKYKEMMKKHYQNITYKIKESKENGDKATVTTEITVVDYSKIIREADLYLQEHPEEFKGENGEYDTSKFYDYRFDKLKDAKDKTKYTLDLTVTKKDKTWSLDPLTETDLTKINGMYQS